MFWTLISSSESFNNLRFRENLGKQVENNSPNILSRKIRRNLIAYAQESFGKFLKK